MNVWPVVVVLLVVAIILVVGSFFVQEDDSPLLSEMADYTLQTTREMQELRTRIAKLEKRASAESEQEKEIPVKKINALMKEQVTKLHQQGKTYDEIGEQLDLPETTVQMLVETLHSSTEAKE